MSETILKCIAIDDEPPALRLIEEYAYRVPGLQLIYSFDDAVSGAEFLRSNPVDVLFIDVNMPDITGIDLVRSLEVKPIIIFTTAFKKFAYDGFELEAVDYLLKPIEFSRFLKAVQKARTLHEQRSAPNTENEFIFVRSEYRMLKIDLDAIEYIEGLEDYIKIHLKQGRPILTLITLKAILEKLPAAKFKRVHRSYIVATSGMVSILHKKVALASGKEIPISDSYLGSINDWIQNNR